MTKTDRMEEALTGLTDSKFNLCSALTASRRLGLISTNSKPSSSLPNRFNFGIKTRDLYLTPAGSDTQTINTAATPGQNNICSMRCTSSALSNSAMALTSGSVKRKAEIKPTIDDASIKEEIDDKKKDERLEKWFGLPKPEMTPQVVRELKAIQLRGVADPKHFFKSTDFKKLPTHFQFATVIDNGKGVGEDTLLFTRKRKSKSLMTGLLKDEQIRNFTHRKATKLHAEAESGGKKWYKQQYKKRKML